MKKITIQFHITIKELFQFIIDLFSTLEITILYCSNSEYSNAVLFNPEINLDISSSILNQLILVPEKINSINDTNFNEEALENYLIFTLGKETPEILTITSLHYFSGIDKNIEKLWKSISNKLKKSMMKGAFIVNSNMDTRSYYKSHLYTEGAKDLYKKGLRILTYEGLDNYYILSEEDNK